MKGGIFRPEKQDLYGSNETLLRLRPMDPGLRWRHATQNNKILSWKENKLISGQFSCRGETLHLYTQSIIESPVNKYLAVMQIWEVWRKRQSEKWGKVSVFAELVTYWTKYIWPERLLWPFKGLYLFLIWGVWWGVTYVWRSNDSLREWFSPLLYGF